MSKNILCLFYDISKIVYVSRSEYLLKQLWRKYRVFFKCRSFWQWVFFLLKFTIIQTIINNHPKVFTIRHSGPFLPVISPPRSCPPPTGQASDRRDDREQTALWIFIRTERGVAPALMYDTAEIVCDPRFLTALPENKTTLRSSSHVHVACRICMSKCKVLTA